MNFVWMLVIFAVFEFVHTWTRKRLERPPLPLPVFPIWVWEM